MEIVVNQVIRVSNLNNDDCEELHLPERTYSRNYYLTNRNKIKDRSKEYYNNNKENYKAYYREYYQENKEYRKLYQKMIEQTHKQRRHLYYLRWRDKRREKVKDNINPSIYEQADGFKNI